MKSIKFILPLAVVICTQAYADYGGDAYRRGYEDGYRRAKAEIEARVLSALRSAGAGDSAAVSLWIGNARYGADGRECDATAAVTRLADGRSEASVVAGNELCGDPAPGIEKRLTVRYECGGRSKTLATKEGGILTLRCQ